jgi:hypothetical protein
LKKILPGHDRIIAKAVTKIIEKTKMLSSLFWINFFLSIEKINTEKERINK